MSGVSNGGEDRQVPVTPRCRHGYVVDECPYPAINCNYSRDYELAKRVPPPAGAVLHPKQVAWAEKQGSPWVGEYRQRNTCPCGYPGDEPCHGGPNGCRREGLM